MADTLFLVCGLLSDATVWRHQLPALADHCEVRVQGFPGYDSIPRMARDLLDGAPERFSIAGHSMGGRVALEVFRLSRERIGRLALLDTGVYPAHQKEAGNRQELTDMAFAQGMDAMARRVWIPSLLHPDRLRDAELVEALAAMALRNTPEQLASQIQALVNRPDMRELLPQIRCRTLVCCGREDAWASANQHVEMARLIPGARLEIIDHCGHMVMMEHPRRVTDLLLQWLEAA
jgi:pimeloyl-ACP methyl ester carboxylesterase